LLSSHLGVCTQTPVDGVQLSFVHRSVSLQFFAGNTQPLASLRVAVGSHTLSVQGSLSSHFELSGVCLHVPAASHWSTVHARPSLAQAVPCGARQWVVSLHVKLLQSAPPAHGSPEWPQVPPLQVSVPLQNLPSSHG